MKAPAEGLSLAQSLGMNNPGTNQASESVPAFLSDYLHVSRVDSVMCFLFNNRYT